MVRITNQILKPILDDSKAPRVLAPFTFDHLSVEARQILHKHALGLIDSLDGISAEDRKVLQFTYHDLMPHPVETDTEFRERMEKQFGPLIDTEKKE